MDKRIGVRWLRWRSDLERKLYEIYELDDRVAHADSLDSILDEFMTGVNNILDRKDNVRFTLHLANKETGQFELTKYWNYNLDEVDFPLTLEQGVSGQVFADGMPRIVLLTDPKKSYRLVDARRPYRRISDFTLEEGKYEFVAKREDIRSSMCIPVKGGRGETSETVGILNVDIYDNRRIYLQDVIDLMALADHVGHSYIYHRMFSETVRLNAMLEEHATRDSLTGLFNRRFYENQILLEIERARSYGRYLSLAVLDLDNFKGVNDIYGHQEGDKLLREIAGVIIETIPHTDFAIRYGGDEFVLIIPEIATPKAKKRIEDIIGSLKPTISRYNVPNLGISYGISTLSPSDGTKETYAEIAAKMFKEADSRMYEHKK